MIDTRNKIIYIKELLDREPKHDIYLFSFYKENLL